MIVICLKGGLGNQLFQYAFGKAMSSRFDLPLYFYNDQEVSHMAIENVFKITLNHFSKEELQGKIGIFSQINVRKFFCKFPRSKLIPNTVKFERKFSHHEIELLSSFNFFEGYWQSDKYFKFMTEDIHSNLCFHEEKKYLPNYFHILRKDVPVVSMHIRRGDYLTTKSKRLYCECDADYYLTAMESILKIEPEARFILFSDDYKFSTNFVATSLVKYNERIFLSDSFGGMHNDLFLMSQCSHNIIANSTYSWWGAWLNRNPNKVVIAPKKWFKKNLNTTDLLPNDWIVR